MTYTQKHNTRNHRQIGAQYEVLAKKYLTGKGYEVLASNYRCRFGEIDIIAKQGSYVVFLEVKYKREGAHGYPRESVTYQKQKRIIHTAKYYLMKTGQYDTYCRFDVIEILDSEITHIENAFI
ncbi:MAG: YraN family protein [Cellulosilyticaceae bacterium]